MDLSQQQWIAILLTSGLTIVFLLGKTIEAVSSRKHTRTEIVDGVPKTVIVEPEGIDLGFLSFVSGFGAFFAFLWMLGVLGVPGW